MLRVLFRGLLIIGFIVLILGGYKMINSREDLTSITVNATNFTLSHSESKQTFVIGNYSNGFKENITIKSSFSISNPDVATVDKNGLIKALSSGTTNIKIRYKNFSKTVFVTVKPEQLQANVREFGAIGDGQTDNTIFFQNAIDYLAEQGGGDVFVPEGTYTLQPIFLEPNVNLIGENRDAVILKLSNNAPDDYTRLISMADNTKVQSITCDGNYLNHPKGTEHMHCIFAFDDNNILIDNNRLMNAVGDGISISGTVESSNYVIISNNIVQENQRSQVVIEQVNHLLMFNNTITSETGRPAVHFEPWEEIQFYDAKITNNIISTNSTEYCVILRGSDSETARYGRGFYYHDIEFNQNVVHGPSCSFLIMDSSGANIHNNILEVNEVFVWRKNKSVSIYKNEITGSDGILVEGGGNGKLTTEGIKVYENTITSLKDEITLLDVKDSDVYDNKLFRLN